MERYRSGHNGADSKSVWRQRHMGSNPILSAKKSPVNSMVCWTFSFCWQDIALAKNPALFRLIFARLIEVVLSEKPYNIKAFLGALIFSRTRFTIPSLAFGVRKRKNIVHNISRSDLWFVVRMTVNIRLCAYIKHNRLPLDKGTHTTIAVNLFLVFCHLVSPVAMKHHW